MKEYKGRVVYNPSGKAGEYSYWAANFYVGCSNGCTYCYLRKGRGAKVLGGNVPELKKVLENEGRAKIIFERELLQNISPIREHGLFFSFTTDPLLPETIGLTIDAIDICQRHGVPVKVLSKCADGISQIIELSEAKKWDVSRIALGATLTGCDELEPNADPNQYRVVVLQRAKNHGFRTFASVEPIPVDAFHRAFSIIKLSYPWIDLYKIGLESGKRYKARETKLFINAVAELRNTSPDLRVYWKDSILRAAGLCRDTLPEWCVARDFNLFNLKSAKI